MAADETRPAGINNEPGVATAECAEPTVDTSHTADQTLQCCSQLLLQITGETPYSHYPESENTHCSTLLQRERVESTLGIVIQETIGIWAEMWGGCFILFPWPNWVQSADDICPIYWPVLRSLITVTSSHSSSHHYYYPALAIRKACNYKIGSQDDRKSSTNQNLNRSFKRQNGTVLISPPTILSHHTIVSLW